jgi:hypothetical protein
MKVVEILPRHRTKLYSTLVAKEAAIRKGGRGTYIRVGRRSSGSTRWKHKMYKGSVQLSHGESEVVTAKVKATTPEDERKLLSSFLGFVDRHSGDQVDTITIQYR